MFVSAQGKAAIPWADPTFKPLEMIAADNRLTPGELPQRRSAEAFDAPAQPGLAGRGWRDSVTNWEASALAHRPLYFEHVTLERYGQTICPAAQPLLSAAHFFGTLPALPYKMGLEPPRELVYVLGYYRPGSPTPRLRYRFPWRLDAALIEATAATGVVFILP